MFPVALSLRGARCLVVGGGEVAERKVSGLISDGARITVIAPEATARLEWLASAGAITLARRPYSAGEAAAYRLVFAATDCRDVNRTVHADAEAAGVWVNVADDPELSTFHLPARIDRGPLTVALSSAGGAPFLVRRLRELLDRWLGPEWSGWAEAAASFRAAVRAARPAAGDREALYDAFFAATVDGARLRVRTPAPEETAGWIGGAPATRGRAGFVSLVGAGPGNGSLLTLRAYRRLHGADVIVYDRLAEPALPGDLPATVELRAVGKEAGHHPVPQDEINALLVALAGEGRRVVRLKGGDPFVFGRGGEEGLALAAAGVPFEVIPGVTAGVAGPAWAGVPATHRGMSSEVTFATAHEVASREGAGEGAGGVQATGHGPRATASPRATRILYMGVGKLAALAEGLLAGGMEPDTPAMVIERGTTSAQRSARAPLANLAEAGRRAGVRPPALVVVGPTVALAPELDWFSRLPLAGQRLALPWPGGELADALELAGAEVVEVVVPLTPAGRVALAALPVTGWVARRAEDVVALAERSGEVHEGGVVSWCLTEAATAAALALGQGRVEDLSGAAAGDGVVRAIVARLGDA